MSSEKAPEVSVVMSVYNGAASLSATLDSVLAQQDCDFEFIVVDDGSSDQSGKILDAYAARDSRIRVIHQTNTGLTRALIAGCAAARGKFMARQDNGDISMPMRLRGQLAVMRTREDVVMVASACRTLGPRGERLFDVARPGAELEEGLSQLDVGRIKGPPHHGSTMFRSDAYFRVGGYRSAFVVAQDIDLWLRLAEVGRLWGLIEVGYEATLEANSISGRRRFEQLHLAKLAIQCAKQRRSGGEDKHLLDRAKALPKQLKTPMSRREKAKFLYFIGSCLRTRDSRASMAYFRESLWTYPLSLKALLRSAIG